MHCIGYCKRLLHGHTFLPTKLNGTRNGIFIDRSFLELLQAIPTVAWNEMWFQHYGVPAHFHMDVHNNLDAPFAGQWIWRGGTVRLSSRYLN